jgi:hypothetical protein
MGDQIVDSLEKLLMLVIDKFKPDFERAVPFFHNLPPYIALKQRSLPKTRPVL